MAANELNLRDYWLILRKRRWVALAALIGVVTFTVIYTNTLTPIYQASVDVRITERKAVTNVLEAFLTAGTMGDPMLSQTKVVQSHAVLAQAAQKLGWITPDAAPDAILAQVSRLKGMISVSVVTDTDIIRIQAEGPDPILVAKAANVVAETYQETNLLDKNSQARSLGQFAEQQLQEVAATLHELEAQLGPLKQQRAAQGQAAAANAQLAALQAQRAALLEQFTELHPHVRQLDERIADLAAQRVEGPDLDMQIAQLERERSLAEQSYTMLQGKYEEARLAEAEKVSDITIVNPAVTPRAPVRPNRQLNYILGLLVGATLSAMSAFVIEHLDASIGTIEDVEQYLQLPVLGIIPFLTPPKAPLAHSSWMTELRQYLMPIKPTKTAYNRLREQTLIHYPPRSAVADAYRLLRTNVRIEVFNNDPAHKILMITSAGNDEGKTINACNLALAFAQEGRRTLLVDADLRRPSVHLCLGFRKKDPGLSNVLTDSCSPEQSVQTFVELMMGEVGFDTAIQTPGLDNLSVITAGATVYSPPDLLESKALDRFCQWAKERYDIIIIDTAPVLAVADPLLVAPKADAVVLVYKVGKTARKAIQRAKFQMESIKAKVRGVILNNISPEIELGTTYYYHQYRTPYEQQVKEDASQLG